MDNTNQIFILTLPEHLLSYPSLNTWEVLRCFPHPQNTHQLIFLSRGSHNNKKPGQYCGVGTKSSSGWEGGVVGGSG